MRPGELASHLGLPVVVDEDIRRLDVSYFLALLVEDGSGFDQVEAQVPQFFVGEGLYTVYRPAVYLILEQEGIVIVSDLRVALCTLQTPFAPHSSVFLNS